MIKIGTCNLSAYHTDRILDVLLDCNSLFVKISERPCPGGTDLYSLVKLRR